MQINKPDLLRLQVQLDSISRRLAVLESQRLGSVSRLNSWPLLQALYVDARTGKVDWTEASSRTWGACISLMTEEVLLDLGRAAGDPFPWRPFLHVLDRFTHHGFDVEESTSHVLSMARNMLNAQGLQVLEPKDIVKAA